MSLKVVSGTLREVEVHVRALVIIVQQLGYYFGDLSLDGVADAVFTESAGHYKSGSCHERVKSELTFFIFVSAPCHD